jgi:uncharacterized protein|tara:strand:+ start:232 stop:441 length:210 start_codon:yes stop_codon:yes gene_type:complete
MVKGVKMAGEGLSSKEKVADDNEKVRSRAGMVILRANSVEYAREIAAKEPMHVAGARTFQVRPWLMNDG